MFNHFSPDSKVWVYQSNRDLLPEEIKQIELLMNDFCATWSAHGNTLQTAGEIFYHRFIVLAVNANDHSASGCSIDKSVHFLKEIEKQFKIDLFDRTQIVFQTADGKVDSFQMNDAQKLFDEGKINPFTIIFNNTASTLHDWHHHWKIKLAESWLMQKIKTTSE